jgi:microsomal dipeptidase-like Zn-dependent dipeptidase
MKKHLNSSNLSHADDIKYLCNNILHIVQVAGPKAWEHICIGSDFDGLVSSIECCRNVTEYGTLAQKLIQELPLMVAGSPAFTHITNINQKVEDIMSGNAYRFLQKYFI